ncbi:MAG: BrnT family toxin [Oscillospiraceae bacterium]|jgi:uncharacterized DUF497 family protein|nr:BrnT family toxin [Oscillospiraceae bacterium]
MYFKWDENKNQSNIAKHGVSFEEAKTVFDDDYAIMIADEAHSIEEERFKLLGISKSQNLLLVCHCVRNENITRIISARKSTKSEEKEYWRN